MYPGHQNGWGKNAPNEVLFVVSHTHTQKMHMCLYLYVYTLCVYEIQRDSQAKLMKPFFFQICKNKSSFTIKKKIIN